MIIGGGYATGRELVEFFLGSGPVGGLLGMLVATVLFSIASVLCFELSRLTRSYDYRSLLRQLLGKGWFVYEIAYFVLGLLVLAVIGAAAGELAAEHLGMHKVFATLLLMALIGLLVFLGTSLIERALAVWSFVLYATYAVLLTCYLWVFGDELTRNIAEVPVGDGWFSNGIRYFGYNLAVIPVILYCVRHMESRRDAFIAGALSGPLIMIPALLFFLAMSAAYPAILDSAVPADFLMQGLDLPWFDIVFYVVVFGTLIETGTAFIHAVNERIDTAFREGDRSMPRWLRPAIAVSALAVALLLAARFGLIELIARGYGTLTWIFIAVFALPLLTRGAWKIWKTRTYDHVS